MSGELPAGWVAAEAATVCMKVQSGGTPKNGFSIRGVPFLKVYNIVNNRVSFDHRPQFVTADVHGGELRKSMTLPGDVLMNIVGPPLNKVAVVPAHLPAANINQAIVLFRPGDGVSSSWIYYWLLTGKSVESLEFETRGSAGQVNISLSQCRRFRFPVAPIAEQYRIVAKVEALLADVNAALDRLEKVPLLLKRFRQSVLAKAFRGELVPTEAELTARENRPYQPVVPLLARAADDVNDELPAGWVDCTLGDVIDGFQAGRNLSGQGRPARGDEFGVLRISAVTWGSFRPEENKALLNGDKPKPHELVRRGDLLITRANTSDLVGAVVLVGQDHPTLMMPDKILRILPKPRVVDPKFLLQALRSDIARGHLSSNATGTSESMRNLSQPKMAATPIRLPPLPEQRRIAAKIEALFCLADSWEQEIERTRIGLARAPQAILQRAFAGELVPTEAELAAKAGREFESADELLRRAVNNAEFRSFR